MIDIFLGQFGGWIVAGLSFVAGAVGLYLKGRLDAHRGAALDAAKDYIKTRERIDHVETPSDPDLAREWLKVRAKRK